MPLVVSVLDVVSIRVRDGITLKLRSGFYRASLRRKSIKSWSESRCRKLVKHGAAISVNTDLALKLSPAT